MPTSAGADAASARLDLTRPSPGGSAGVMRRRGLWSTAAGAPCRRLLGLTLPLLGLTSLGLRR